MSKKLNLYPYQEQMVDMLVAALENPMGAWITFDSLPAVAQAGSYDPAQAWADFCDEQDRLAYLSDGDPYDEVDMSAFLHGDDA